MSETEFFERLKQNPRPVVVDFWAPWCGPCRMVEPVLKKVGKEYKGQVDIWKINADDYPDLLRHYRIYGIPTLIGFNAGEEIVRQTGVSSQDAMIGLFEAALSGEKPASPGLTIFDRLLRVAIGLALLFLAYSGGFRPIDWIFVGLAGVAFFTAVYDRCPIWNTIAPRIKALLGKGADDQQNPAA